MTPSTPEPGTALRARVHRLSEIVGSEGVDPDRSAAIDPISVAGADGHLWSGDGIVLAGTGVALRIAVERSDPAAVASKVHDALALIPVDGAPDDLPGVGPVAFGSFPFRPDLPGELVVPAATCSLVGDDGWITTVLAQDATDDEHVAAAREVAERGRRPEHSSLAGFSASEPLDPSSFELRSSRPPEEWCDALADARDRLRAGDADKVVIAREVTVVADAPLPVERVLRRLASAYPEGLRFSMDGFVGASPELLVARRGTEVTSHPMAGTAPRRGDPVADAALADALRASPKNTIEHRHTIDLVHDALLPYCSYLDEEAEPSVVALHDVQHLATRVEGQLSSPPASVVELMCVLHPTPAVCGRPTDAALELIERFEALDRGRYAGPVGWVDAHGNGSWAVGIRSAELDGSTARVFAGVGVVADSDPRVELAETRAKLQAVLSAIVRP